MSNKASRSKSSWLIIIIMIVVFMALRNTSTDSDYEESSKITNSGDSTYTLMVYMCGSDLESQGGYASADIAEMLKAKVDDKVNLIIETGGTKKWQNYGISNKSNQIYKVENNKLNLVHDFGQLKYMSFPSTLAEFIDYCRNQYPADKYGLVFWDHGGGAVSGYGYDENNPDEEDTLTLAEIKAALDAVDLKFEFIGFDACLMGNIETAYAIKDHANYLIASEETEPGTGWNYLKVVNKLSSNTSDDTTEFGKTVVDSFIDSNNSFFSYDEATLSVIDLSKIENVYDKLNSFLQEIKTEDLDNNKFAKVAKAVSNSKSYAEGEYDTFDLADFANKVNNSQTDALIDALEEAVVYNRTTDLVENSNGLSIYIPYKDLSYYQKMTEIYPKIGVSEDYVSTLTKFASIVAGGKNDYYVMNSHTYEVDNNYSQYSWYDENTVEQYSDYYRRNRI